VRLFQTLAALAAVLVVGAKADAAFTLKLDSGASSSTINLVTGFTTGSATYSAASLFSSSAADVFQLNFAGYVMSIASATNNVPGTSALGSLTFSISTMRYSGTGPSSALKFTLTADGYTTPAPHRLLQGGFNSLFSAGPVSVKYTSTYVNGSPVSVTDTLSGTNQSSTKSLLLANSASNYSLTSVYEVGAFSSNTRLTSGGADTSVINPAPAPPALLLALLGVPAFGLIARRMNRKPTVDAEEAVAA
jgi:hypothetical protein